MSKVFWQWFWAGIISIIVLALIIWLVAFMRPAPYKAVPIVQVQAAFQCIHTNGECHINNGHDNCCFPNSCIRFNSHSDNGKCGPRTTPSPSPSPSPSPTLTPTPTPECDGDCVTPTPEVTPAPSGNGGNPPTFAGSSTNPPAAPSCTVPFDPPILQGFERLSPTSVKFSWWPGSADTFSIVYGYAEGQESFGMTDIKGTSVTLNDLSPNTMVWGQVWGMKNGCAEKSAWIDP